MLAGLVFVVPQSEANAATTGITAPQVRWQIARERNRYRRLERNRYNRIRRVTTTRIVRIGFRTYRETIRTTYLPNGRMIRQVIRRVRIR